jgi:lysozyme family protein
MQSSYVATIDRIITRYEGNYGWDRGDPGGPTKYGITCYDLAEHRHQKMTSMAKWAPIVQGMTLAEAQDIYATKYAVGVRYNDLPLGVDACMLDYGINSGVSRPINVARALMKVKGSGAIDQPLLDAIKKANAYKFIQDMDAERLAFMHAIKGGAMWAKFGHGWNARVVDLTAYSEHLASGGTKPEPIPPDLTNVVTPKAIHVAPTAGPATSGGLVASAGAAYAAGLEWKYVALAAGSALTLGVGYELWQAHKTSVANATIHLPAGA